MHRPLLAIVNLVAACDATTTGRPCTVDSDCGAERCLEGICAPALEDPGGPPSSPGGRVRVIAVGLHPTLEDVVSQDTWRAYVARELAEDVLPHLATDRPNLVVLPENATLTAAFIGARGEAARAATSSTAAFTAVLAAHTAAIDFYNARTKPGVPIGRLLGLVVTDTVWRAIDAWRDAAREHGFWLALTGDFAIAERTTDGAAIAAVVDEAERDRSFAYIAIDDDVHNQTLLVSPEGEVIHSFRKAYLVPIEERGLDLDYGPVEDLRAFDLPFARVASVISKDAWMPDVLDRLALDGAALMLQPEAFSGWGIPHGEEGSWAPDVVQESGWAHIMRYPEFQASVLPCWNGNLFELVFDCQTSILAQPRHDPGRGAWIGQDDEIGYARVAPWAIDDPRTGTRDDRRAALIAYGMRLAPGSGDPLENAYAHGSVWLDLDLAAPWPVRAPAEGEILVAPSDAGEQRRPALASGEDGRFVVIWEDTRRGATRLYGARGQLVDGNLVIGPARMRVPTEGEPRRPRLAALGDVVHLVWQEAHGADHDAMYARSIDGGRSFLRPRPLGDPEARAAPQWTPDIAVHPVDGDAWACWIDRRAVGARVMVTRIDAPGDYVPGGLVAKPYTTRANQHLPAIAVRDDGPWVVWTDFEEYRWRIRGAHIESGAWVVTSVDDADVPFETIHSDPRIASLGDRILAVWTDLRVRRPDYDVRVREIRAAGPSLALASSDDRGRPQWRPAVAVRGEHVLVVWQDMRGDHQTLRYALSRDRGVTFGPDAPLFAEDDGIDRYGPEVVFLDDAHALIAYETTASGARRIALRLLAL